MKKPNNPDSNNQGKVEKRDYDFSRKSLKARGSTVTRAKILDSLKEFAKIKNTKTFAFHEFDSWGDKCCRAATAARHFDDSWPNAMEAAGLRACFVPNKKDSDFRKMVQLYMDCWQKHDTPPTQTVFKDYLEFVDSPYSVHAVKRHFGGWENLRRRIVDWHSDKADGITEKQLIAKHSPKNGARKAIPVLIRRAILERDNYTCRLCGQSPSKHHISVHVDHIVPYTVTKDNSPENLQTLCEACNFAKSDNVS